MNQRGFIALPALSPLGWVLVGMGVLCVVLTGWALLERSGRLGCKAELVTAQAQIAVLSDTITRQNAGIQAAADAGAAAQEGVANLLEAARKLSAAGSALGNTIAHARGVIGKPPPKRPDGKDVDCTDAWREIEGRAKP